MAPGVVFLNINSWASDDPDGEETEVKDSLSVIII
jgi:hypothetical protein